MPRGDVRVNCPECGTANVESRKFCGECGAALLRICPRCTTPNPPDVKFCGECGSALQATAGSEPVPAAPAPAVTERRLVSVLFLDLVGFTTISEQRDAEDMRALLSSYFDTARTVIERHGGVVEKFIGDAVMAVWGTPVAHEDDAERAVRTALELVDAVHALGEREGAALQARAGVLTGEAATMPGAVSEGMVTGDMVNTASRLQSAADPGTVYVGEATFRGASRAIAFEEIGALTLKGKESPVRAWRALRVVAERGGANRMAIEPPFVGRQEELRLLKELLHATGRDGKARVVSVTGIGGIGKSRLGWELEKYVDGLTEDVYWHQGRCPAYGDGVTFWALGEMVRMRAGIAEGDDTVEARTKLTRAVEAHVPDADERLWIEPRLAFLLALDERPSGGGEELYAAWRTFFERIAANGPVVMVFEDLQWADPGLLDFIGSVLEWSRNEPILVLTLSRPELADRRPDWGAGQRAFTSLHLESLPDASIRELVLGLVPQAPAEVVDRIVGRAEGVPLYAVETIRMLADRGVLRAGESAYELTQPLEDLEIPETLQSLIASRLDSLDASDRALLQDAAVLGKSFTIASLVAVSGRGTDELEPRLPELIRRELLRLDADPRSPERGQYSFTQSLIREVAYGTVSKADRRARHLTVAHHFESEDDPELAGIVAAHYVEALRSTPEGPDADALAARARDWLRQASERAASLGAPIQALAFCEQALDLTDGADERRALLEIAARAAGDALRLQDQVRFLREAAALARAAGDRLSESRSLIDLIDPLFAQDHREKVVMIARDMRARFADDDDLAVRAQVAAAASLAAYLDEDYGASLHAIEEQLTLLESVGDTARLMKALGHKIVALGLAGRPREAKMLVRGYVETVRRSGDRREIATGLGWFSLLLVDDDPRAAFDALVEATDIARKAGYGSIEVPALTNGVEASVELGEWSVADAQIARLREIGPSLATTDAGALAIGEALLAAYRGDDATAVASLNTVEELGNPMFNAWLHRMRSVAATQGGDPDAGYDAAIAAIAAQPSGPNAPLALWSAGRAALWSAAQLPSAAERIRRAMDAAASPRGAWVANVRASLEAAIAGVEGRREESVDGFRAALETWDEMSLPFDHAMTVGDAIVVLGSDAVPPAAIEHARTFLERIGAVPLLARLGGSVDAVEQIQDAARS